MIQVFAGRQVAVLGGSTQVVSRRLRNISDQLTEEVVPRKLSLPANKLCALGIYEFLKNILHGDHQRVEVERLPNGTLLLFTTDVTGEGLGELDPAYCGHQGTMMIQGVFGEQNYRTHRCGALWVAELHVIPEEVLRLAG